MNQIRKPNRERDEIAAIREIVGRHERPNFLTGFDVRLGEFDGDPAMWVTFRMKDEPQHFGAEMAQRADALEKLRLAVMDDLLEAFEDRYPYFKFQLAEPEPARP